jgi:hypothetical protein
VTESPLVPYALAYAERGLVVMPLKRLGNVPHGGLLGKGWRFSTCTGKPTEPPVGSTDPAFIREWWSQDPAANVGVVTGERSRLLVLDLDVHDGDGLTSFVLWQHEREREGKMLPPHPVVQTPSGGRHRWFALPPGACVKKNDYWLPSVEAKGCGAQVAVPPSGREVEALADEMVQRTVEQYRFLTDVPLPLAPGWLLEDVRTRKDATARRMRAAAGANGGTWDGRSCLPPTGYFLEHGFGAEGGHREPDCYQLACRLWRRHPGREALVLDVIRRVWERTSDKPTGKPFTWEDAQERVENAREFVEEQRESELAAARRLRGET